jgi:hypothetical protein
MTKILSTLSPTATLVSALAAVTAKTLRAVTSVIPSASASGIELPQRLRYDLGELDINPDCVRGGSRRNSGTSVADEMMRRSF